MRTGGLVRLCGFVVPILDLFLRERSHADHDLDALALLLPGHEVGVSCRRHRGCGALLGLPERRPDCVRARVRAADAPSRRLVCRDGGPRADGQRNTKACGFGEFGGSTPPGRRRLRGVVPAPAGRPPGAARALSLARARRGAPRPASLGTAADPVLGRSIYLFVCRRAARARTRTTIKTGFSSRFATTCDRGRTSGHPRGAPSRVNLYRARRRLVPSATRVNWCEV